MAFWSWIENLVVSTAISWLLKPDEPDFSQIDENTNTGTLVNKASSLAQIPVIYGKRGIL